MSIEHIRLSLLIALAAVVFLMWQAWQRDYAQPPQPSSESTAPASPSSGDARADVRGTPAIPAQRRPARPAGTGSERPTIRVRTDVLSVEIDLRGGDLRRADLLRYPVAPAQPHTPVRLFNDTEPDIFVAQSGLIGAASAPDHHSLYNAEQSDYRLSPSQDELKVALRWEGPGGVRVTKTYTFRRNSYVVEVSHRVQNAGDAPWRGRMYAQFQRTEPPHPGGLFRIYTYTGGVVSTQEDSYRKVDFGDRE
ncbi:MAG: membrane protein insertase YidC [Gammaproteobacteria bacterium]|nr:membrane protein insertase YidC [Gammaproteobacteria bacterium]